MILLPCSRLKHKAPAPNLKITDHTIMHNTVEHNAWFMCSRPNPMARVRLFCFPYAGGGASIFHSWADRLPSDIETIGIQMPGLESRIMEPPVETSSTVVEMLLPVMYSSIDKPFVLFGHSLGAFICFELTRRLRERYGLQPLHMFVAGIRAPQILNQNPTIYNLPETEFLEKLQRRYSGVPDEILENPDILQLVLPGLRASLKMYECYKYIEDEPLDCDITAFGGYQDRGTTTEDLEAWRYQTNRSFSLQMFSGNHFFINSEQEHFLQTLSSELMRILSQLE
jgi:medium-chain acyl-[acyl-carrier-protein] hydrolase